LRETCLDSKSIDVPLDRDIHVGNVTKNIVDELLVALLAQVTNEALHLQEMKIAVRTRFACYHEHSEVPKINVGNTCDSSCTPIL